MRPEASIEERLDAVETAIAELQRRVAPSTPSPHWLERFTGAFKDEPAFAEVVEFGRAIRAADRSQQDEGS